MTATPDAAPAAAGGRQVPQFKVFAAPDAAELEGKLNRWATTLPPGAKVRRTQLAADDHSIYALINYEV